jgi:hypothetical protein
MYVTLFIEGICNAPNDHYEILFGINGRSWMTRNMCYFNLFSFHSAKPKAWHIFSCPRVSCRAEVKICQILVPIDLTEVLCFGRLHRRTPLGNACLEIAESDGIRSCMHVFYISQFWFQRKCCEALLAVTIVWHNFLIPWWSQLAENVMEAVS